MLGGLARWLRAAGYDASWHDGINDTDLVRLSREEGRTLLTADTGIFLHGGVRDGLVPALFVPLRLSPQEQLAHVLSELRLPRREPRCMACGGGLSDVPKEMIRDRVPERTFAWLDRFWQCVRCGQVFWRGSHWERIEQHLRQAAAEGESGH
jgi:uncharacterized protein with PIN domain